MIRTRICCIPKHSRFLHSVHVVESVSCRLVKALRGHHLVMLIHIVVKHRFRHKSLIEASSACQAIIDDVWHCPFLRLLAIIGQFIVL